MNKGIKNLLIGIFVIAACIIIVLIILFIQPSLGDGKQVLHVRFNNIAGIQDGTRVTLAGKPIGEVESITRVPQAREKAVGHLGQVYYYLLTLRIDSHYKVFSTDEITVQTQGLLGEKYIAIVPKPILPGQKPHLITSKDVIYGDSTDILESAMNELSRLSAKVDTALQTLIDWMHKYGDDVGDAVNAFKNTVKDIGLLVQNVNQNGIVDNIQIITKNLIGTTNMINYGLGQLQSQCFYDNLGKTMQNIELITEPLAEGTSTLGKLIQDDGMYLELNAIMMKINTLLNDINNYGLLFQYDKKWQRERARKAATLDKISTPREFRSAIESQLDELNVTLSRLKMLSDMQSNCELSCNKDFQKAFYDFYQKIKDLQLEVEYYNMMIFDGRESCGK